ncbi:MAG: VCBS repeat-containing protein [Methanobacteriota archaeon]|nr:MAG: VCBS repeat-containing protein [Euryarchaeota archaeon]
MAAVSTKGHLNVFSKRVSYLVLVLFVCMLYLPNASMADRSDLFVARADYGVGALPWDVVADDFDDNGFLDLVNVNRGSDSVSVALNNGDGTFEDTKWTYPVGNEPWAIDSADLNNDGDVDLAVSRVEVDASGPPSEYFDYVSVLLNYGDGSFSAYVEYPVGDDPASVFLADLGEDGNNDIDIITANGGESNSVSVLFNDGSGVFSLPTNYSVGADPHSVFVADLNGDGYNDAVTANRDDDNITVLINNGTGVFDTHRDYDVGLGPWDIYLENVVGDASLDIVVLSKIDGNVWVLENDGAANFPSSVSYSVNNNNSISLVVGDADLDGFKDILCSSWGEPSLLTILYYNSGTSDYERHEIPIDGGARSFVLADLAFGIKGFTNIAAVVPGDDIVTVLVSDTPPTIFVAEPDGTDDVVELEFRIEWVDFDPDSNATVRLYYFPEGAPTLLTEIANFSEDDEDDYYIWNVSLIELGDYYIKAVITDDYSSQSSTSTGPVTVFRATPPPEEPFAVTSVTLALIILGIVGAVLTVIVLYWVLRKKPPAEEYFWVPRQK